MDAYVHALCCEIVSYRREPKITLDTVFFGGGTPTLLGEKRLLTILCAVFDAFSVLPNAEISIEMNPATADETMLSHLREAGWNRVSVGVQSMVNIELKALGRVHTAEDARRSLDAIIGAGFANYSVDLMYAIPHQTLDSFRYTVEQIMAYQPPHISLYSLIVEEGTPFWEQKDRLNLPDENRELDMYHLATDYLSSLGYQHYEISNYARSGYHSRHNFRYWTLSPYIGVGPAAHSFFEGKRYENVASIEAYLASPLSARQIEEIPNMADLAEEYVMLGLRTSEGISLATYEQHAGHPLLKGKEEWLKQCQREGYVELEGDRLRFTEKGFYLSLGMLAELLS